MYRGGLAGGEAASKPTPPKTLYIHRHFDQREKSQKFYRTTVILLVDNVKILLSDNNIEIY